MQRTCVQCGLSFEVTSEDLAFYDKVSPVFSVHVKDAGASHVAQKKYQIPPPTRCPECRNQRRMAWRNERSLYVRTCECCKRSRVSAFAPESRMHTFCRECLYSDVWDPLARGRNYDFSRSFRSNLQGLLDDTPVMMLYQSGLNENCEYINFAGTECKNCYLIFNSGRDEDCYHSRGLIESRNCADMLICSGDELCYECVNCSDCYRVMFSQNCAQCRDSAFLFNCRQCRNCFGCTNLIQKEYHLFNVPCTPDAYQAALSRLHSAAFIEENTEKLERMRLSCIQRATSNIHAEECSGDYITAAKNCKNCYEVMGAEDCKWLTCAKRCRDSYDLFGYGYDSELLYEDTAVGLSISAAFSFTSSTISNSYYCLYCDNAQECFGCISLHRKRHCILNKQYSKEDYERLVPQIIAQMRTTGEWGEFLPADMSPFGYNETVAQEYCALSRDEVLKRGWKWRDETDEMPQVEKIMTGRLLPDSIDDIPEDIVNWAIKCEATGRPFRIIKEELQFYRKMRLPVPRFHPDERHRRRMAFTNPRKLWKRQCGKCGKEMQTTYQPSRPEVVYCERCYLETVY